MSALCSSSLKSNGTCVILLHRGRFSTRAKNKQNSSHLGSSLPAQHPASWRFLARPHPETCGTMRRVSEPRRSVLSFLFRPSNGGRELFVSCTCLRRCDILGLSGLRAASRPCGRLIADRATATKPSNSRPDPWCQLATSLWERAAGPQGATPRPQRCA